MAFVRGRFCELAAARSGLDATEQYLIGLLSMLPAMLRLPMAELTPTLPLRNEVRRALEGEPRAERSLLAWIEFYEYGDWAACDQLVQAKGLNQDQLMACATEAMVWAEAAMKFA